MNAPTTAAALAKPSLVLVAIAKLHPSKSHVQELRRSRFTTESLQKLAEDIKHNGLMQHPLVRQLPPANSGNFEIVAGERRWLAAKRAGLGEIYVNVRELDDNQALEAQLSENLQREDLHELEEAEGYEELMKLKKITADEVAAMISQSRSYVYARLKLIALCPEARKAFYAGELDASRALLIARIGHHDTQRQALKDITKGEHGRGPMTYREAHHHILHNFMLKLAGAPFDIKDATLLPKAGDCIKCPKRTGNQADLFGDVKNVDVCTDPKCFDDKRQAHFAAPRKALEAKGKKVIYGSDAKKIFEDWDSPNGWARDRMRGNQYVKLDETSYTTGRNRKVSEILGEDYDPILIQHPGTGQIIKVATQQAIAKAATSKKKAGQSKKSGGGGYNYSAQEKARELERRLENETRDGLFAAIHAKVGETGKEELLQIVKTFAHGNVDVQAIGKLWGWKISRGYNPKQFLKLAATLPPAKLTKLVFELALSEEAGAYGEDDVLLEQAKRLKINAQAIADEVKARLMPVEHLTVAEKIPAGKPAFQAARALATIVGAHPITREECLKRVRKYVALAKLADKKNIKLDAKLRAALGKTLPQIAAFELGEMVNAQLKIAERPVDKVNAAIDKRAAKRKGKKKSKASGKKK